MENEQDLRTKKLPQQLLDVKVFRDRNGCK